MVSKLIEKLQAILEEHGDLSVEDEAGTTINANSIETKTFPGSATPVVVIYPGL